MKRTIKLKIAVATTLLCTGMASQAQWATFNVSDALYDYFKSMRDYVMNSNLEAISNGQALQMAQANQNVANADYRNRLAMATNDILREDEAERPTYAQCVEISRSQVGVATVSSSLNGRSKGSGPRKKGANPTITKDFDVTSIDTIQQNLQTSTNVASMSIANMKAVGACSDSYGEMCSGASKTYEKADVKTVGLLTNMNQTQVKKDSNGVAMEFANYSMDDAGYKAGQQYINNATLSNAPLFLNKDDLAKNPKFLSTYNSIITKLNASADAMKQLLDIRKASTSMSSSYSTIWNSMSADWDTIYPSLKKPTNPSFFEFMNFKVMADVFGPTTVAAHDDTTKGLQNAIYFNNLIAWNQYKQTETNNVLLAHILVQLTTPVSKDAYNQSVESLNKSSN